mgnify:CR=1 FL=1
MLSKSLKNISNFYKYRKRKFLNFLYSFNLSYNWKQDHKSSSNHRYLWSNFKKHSFSHSIHHSNTQLLIFNEVQILRPSRWARKREKEKYIKTFFLSSFLTTFFCLYVRVCATLFVLADMRFKKQKKYFSYFSHSTNDLMNNLVH